MFTESNFTADFLAKKARERNFIISAQQRVWPELADILAPDAFGIVFE